MKVRVIIFLMSCLMVSVAGAQTQKPVKTEPAKTQPQTKPQPKPEEPVKPAINPLTEHFYKKYVTALQWNDYAVAKDALYDLIMENPQNDSLIFNLAYYYYENQQYPSSVLVSQQLLARNPKNTAAIEISAVGYEFMGVPDRALQNYESLYLLTNNITALYKMSFLQYDLKRFGECLTSIDILLANKNLDGAKVVFNDVENKQKEYPMKVAIVNLKGMAVLEHLGDKAAAKKLYEEALAISPDFVLAKQNLAKVK
jgi:tetratricopeptide (TPR) repeat protein